ncbi:hypothetical protein D7S89_15785 [Trinickia fusca]|uniref:Uncharacterized protein n=2 Tax=Trinickia fusca TaxID=2419777 RepID=A0A494X8G5_9BURK|nr:hypothetical protein D7S89_15785 [Trinickia fusca]
MIGTRRAYSNQDLTNNGTYFEQVASTDGYVMATIGQPTYTDDYGGTLAGQTFDGGSQTSFVYATGAAFHFKPDPGKKGGGATVKLPVPGSFTMPVKKSEKWTLTFTVIVGSPKIEFYWIPLGPPPTTFTTTTMAGPAPVALPGGGMASILEQSRADLASGRIGATMQDSARQAIAQRMDDLTDVLGNATGMSQDEQDRQRFRQELAKVVCAPESAPLAMTSTEFARNVESLVDMFGRVTGHDFTAEQHDLVAAGVRALVQINENDANRHDLTLIKNNIDLFIDNVREALHLQLDTQQRRLLTRALVRIVGDGSQGDR